MTLLNQQHHTSESALTVDSYADSYLQKVSSRTSDKTRKADATNHYNHYNDHSPPDHSDDIYGDLDDISLYDHYVESPSRHLVSNPQLSLSLYPIGNTPLGTKHASGKLMQPVTPSQLGRSMPPGTPGRAAPPPPAGF